MVEELFKVKGAFPFWWRCSGMLILSSPMQPLAVRHKDFHKNIKKHYAKLLKVLQGYALSCTNVRLSVVNTSSKGGRQVVLATQAHQRTGDNIASVFGTKFFRTLVPVDFVLDDVWPSSSQDDDDMSDNNEGATQDEEEKEGDDPVPARSVPDKKATIDRRVIGYVSKVGAGVGRSDNDRQFFFINGRPFELPKVCQRHLCRV